MITVNEAGWDRTLRTLLGLVLLYLGWAGIVTGWLTGAVVAIGIVLLISGFTGWCPLYSLLGTGTLRRPTLDERAERVRTLRTRSHE